MLPGRKSESHQKARKAEKPFLKNYAADYFPAGIYRHARKLTCHECGSRPDIPLYHPGTLSPIILFAEYPKDTAQWTTAAECTEKLYPGMKKH
jgi:hypothetical protein